MPTVIDGNNLIGSSPDISLDDPDCRQKIVQMVRKYQELKNNKMVLVFDGEPDFYPPGKSEKMKFRVLFPRMGESADDVIKKILAEYNDFKDVVLISSDRELKSFAKLKGARTLNSIEFYFELKRVRRQIGSKEEHYKFMQSRLSDKEVDHWLKVFEND